MTAALGRRVAVRVPATSANLGPGFDTLGLALSVYDELTVEALEPGRLEIEVSGEGTADVPRDASHLVDSGALRATTKARLIGSVLNRQGAKVAETGPEPFGDSRSHFFFL